MNDPDLEDAYNLETPEDARRLYRNWAASYDEDFARRRGYRFAEIVAKAYLAAGGVWPALDAGCGTGLVATHLPEDAVIDGIDISPEMLAEAERKGRYRALMEADLTRPLPVPEANYAGLISSGTFTHGHVGPEALEGLLRALAPGAVCAITSSLTFFETRDFGAELERLERAGAISAPSIARDRIYAEGAEDPDGHGDDIGLVITFRRL